MAVCQQIDIYSKMRANASDTPFWFFADSYEASSSLTYRETKMKMLRKQKTTYEKVAGVQILVSKSEGVQLSHCLEDHPQSIFVIHLFLWVLQMFFKVSLPKGEAQIHVASVLLKLEELQ